MGNSTNILVGNVTANSTGLFIDPHNLVNPANAIVMPTFGIIAIMMCYLPLRDFFRLLIGLTTHRKIISCTLASTGSGMSSKYFIKLSIIGITSILIWGPIQMFYASLNWPRPLHPYNFAAIHQPEKWNQIIFLPTSLNGQLQYNGWAGIAMSFMIYAYFGFNSEAINTYRGWLVKCGLGKIWPSLKEPRISVQRSRDGSQDSRRTSLSEKLDLVGKAMRFFDGGRKDSLATTTTGVGSTIARFSESGRKDSQATISTGMNTDPDAITPLPEIPEAPSPHLYSSPVEPSPPAKRLFFSVFRTHLNLPFHLFGSSPQSSGRSADTSPTHACATCGRHQNADLEAQNPRPITAPSGPPNSSFVQHDKNRPVLRTNIWSETGQFFEAISKGHEKIHREKEKEEGKDKMGTKPYRGKEKMELGNQKDGTAGVANAVIVEHALERRESEVNIKTG
ncbi:putative pheromone a factor receptor [Amylocarpus encephaloides]|uniref:Pheromone a factor receptor n=1 Tax=Amylocarpus encephaloides TaxID=45428 RepID=A0A9P7YVA9_9HELO|nr:putative pheromone a factor receptor [Amylocarpus encephaloides]